MLRGLHGRQLQPPVRARVLGRADPSPRAPPLKSGCLYIYLPQGSTVVRLARAFIFEEVEARVDGATRCERAGRAENYGDAFVGRTSVTVRGTAFEAASPA